MIESAKASLPDQLGRVRTYSKYWDDEIAAFEKSQDTTLDAQGIKNFFVDTRPRAQKLDTVAEEIRGFASQDLNDPAMLNALVDKFQYGRRLIYGNDPHQARRLVFGPDAKPEDFQNGFQRAMSKLNFFA